MFVIRQVFKQTYVFWVFWTLFVFAEKAMAVKSDENGFLNLNCTSQYLEVSRTPCSSR